MQILIILNEFYNDFKTHKTRAILTIVAIAWGTLAVILLMSFGFGLSNQVNKFMRNAGNRVIRLYGGQTRKTFQGLPEGRRIRLTEYDYYFLKDNLSLIDGISAQFGRGVRLRNGDKTASTYMEGVFPAFEYLRRLYPGPGGRFINDNDMAERKRVVFLGEVIAEELFGTPDAVGKTVLLEDIPFTVIGVMPRKTQMGMNNGPDERRAIIPFSTFKNIYGYQYLSELIVRPKSVLFNQHVIRDIRELLGRKYQFDPTDHYALGIWDHVENEKTMNRMFIGINIFLAVLGTMSLVVAGVGVANIMYVVVKERTREIGIKRAIGAKKRHIILQFILESICIAAVGGTAGFIVSAIFVKIMWMMPAEEEGVMQFLGRPQMSSFVIFTAVGVLAMISILAGYFPARKAAKVDPVEALRYE
ncbi:ABC transporter permease [candidate division KSB1 bacterium]|nr:ABC transporter permease [candidate division KSB1 bacterium]